MQFFRFILVSPAYFALLAQATPLTSIIRRNPCDGIDLLPVIDHEYREDECPAINKFEPQIPAQCQGVTPSVECASFCQVRTEFQFGREAPLNGTFCHGPINCTVSSSDTTTIGYKGGVTIGQNLFNAIEAGVTAGYVQGDAHAIAEDSSVHLDKGECGYFTFVPVMRTFCGTLSHGDSPDKNDSCVNIVNEQNWCDTTPRTINGQADGETIFVKTDCETRQPLSMDQQDTVYQHSGVALDNVADILNTWAQDTCKVDYQFFDDYFQITGKNWSTDLLGPNGDNLKKAIQHCGKLTSWHFKMEEDGISWFADVRLEIAEEQDRM
ncbi:hypothetical protein F5Y18DRAFT_428587 [Xylariaceae sp. FL1019]|nr:hypothetical protein F5Y18DRAFT_428587 [Xylariaceae sp. FL1019]